MSLYAHDAGDVPLALRPVPFMADNPPSWPESRAVDTPSCREIGAESPSCRSISLLRSQMFVS